MVGDWIAESMVVTSLINPDVSPDIVQFGAAFTLTVQPSGKVHGHSLGVRPVLE